MRPLFRTSLIALALSLSVPLSSPGQARAEASPQVELQAARELYASGDWETAKEAYGKAYEAAPEGSATKAEAALEWGSILWEQGMYSEAERRVSEALKLARSAKLDHALGRLMLTLGHVEASRGKFDEAESTLKVCVRLTKEQRDANFEALCRMNLRFVRQLRGKSVGPQSEYARDLKLLESSGSPLLVGTALAKSAELREKAGDPAQALDLLERAGVHFATAGSVPAQSRHQLRLAQLYQDLGRWGDAAKALKGLQLRFKGMRNRPALVTTYGLIGRQAAHAGDTAAAKEAFEAAVAQARGLDSPHLKANAHLGMCEFLARQTDDRAGIEEHCGRAEDLFTKASVPMLATRARIALARRAQAAGDLQEARKRYLQVVEALEQGNIADSPDHRRDVATQLVNLCQVELQLKANGALARCRRAVKAVERMPAGDAQRTPMLAAARYGAGNSAARAKAHEEAVEHLTRAAELYTAAEDPLTAADAYLRLGDVLKRQKGKQEAASEAFAKGMKATEAAGAPGASTRIQLRIQRTQILLEMEQWEAAKAGLELLVEEAAVAGDHGSGAWALSGLAQARLKLGDRDGAIGALKQGLPLAKKAGDDEMAELLQKNLEALTR